MISMINGIMTALLLIVFVGIWVWAWSKKNKQAFDEMARLPLEDSVDKKEEQEK